MESFEHENTAIYLTRKCIENTKKLDLASLFFSKLGYEHDAHIIVILYLSRLD